jgi:5-methyltetrahydrofolate--homocysteine methyltransferase
METTVASKTKEVLIGHMCPTVLIGERINPTGRKKMMEALRQADFDLIRREALDQIQTGADILDVNTGVPDLDEPSLLVEAIRQISAVTDAPLCIDSNSLIALAAALEVYEGKALVNSVSGKEESLEEILPLVKQHRSAVIGLPMDESGIPDTPDGRLKNAGKIIDKAVELGIPESAVIIDCLAMSVGADSKAAQTTLETIRLIKKEFGCLTTLGASNISFGLPDRGTLNSAFLSMAIFSGLNCPIVEASKVQQSVLAADLLMGRDPYARRYTEAYRRRNAG